MAPKGYIDVEFDSKWECVTQCVWQNHLFDVGDVIEMKAGSQIPHHFRCISGQRTFAPQQEVDPVTESIRHARSWQVLEAVAEDLGIEFEKVEGQFDETKEGLIAQYKAMKG